MLVRGGVVLGRGVYYVLLEREGCVNCVKGVEGCTVFDLRQVDVVHCVQSQAGEMSISSYVQSQTGECRALCSISANLAVYYSTSYHAVYCGTSYHTVYSGTSHRAVYCGTSYRTVPWYILQHSVLWYILQHNVLLYI